MQRLYVIIDRATLDARSLPVIEFASELRDAGVTLLQYRDKVNGPQEILWAAEQISAVFKEVDATLILNDRADLWQRSLRVGVCMSGRTTSRQRTSRLLIAFPRENRRSSRRTATTRSSSLMPATRTISPSAPSSPLPRSRTRRR